jgi:hypothetical protein
VLVKFKHLKQTSFSGKKFGTWQRINLKWGYLWSLFQIEKKTNFMQAKKCFLLCQYNSS